MKAFKKELIRIGDILRVSQGSEFHFERVTQIIPEILTEDLNPDDGGDSAIQGIAENLKYEILETHEIAKALENTLKGSHLTKL